MAAAGTPAESALLVEVQELRTSLQGLDTSVTSRILNVQQLKTDMKDLLSSADGGVYGESYASDSGPAVRAKSFETFVEASRGDARQPRPTPRWSRGTGQPPVGGSW